MRMENLIRYGLFSLALYQITAHILLLTETYDLWSFNNYALIMFLILTFVFYKIFPRWDIIEYLSSSDIETIMKFEGWYRQKFLNIFVLYLGIIIWTNSPIYNILWWLGLIMVMLSLYNAIIPKKFNK